MNINIPPNNSPIAGTQRVTGPFATWFQQVYNVLTGGDILVIRTSPNGTRYSLGVDNSGNSVWTPL